MANDSKTVHLDGLLVRDLLLDEEGFDRIALVALELQNFLSRLFVLKHGTVAAVLFLDGLLDLLQV